MNISGSKRNKKLNNLTINTNSSQHAQHDEVGHVQSKTIFSYRMSLLSNYLNLELHDTQRFLMHNILSKIYSDEQRDLLIHWHYAEVFTYIFVRVFRRHRIF